MKQFQFEYQSNEEFVNSIKRIKQWCIPRLFQMSFFRSIQRHLIKVRFIISVR